METKSEYNTFADNMTYCIELMADAQKIYDRCSESVLRNSAITLIMIAVHSFMFHGKFSIAAILLLLPAIILFTDVIIDVVVLLLCVIQMNRCKKYMKYVVKKAFINYLVNDGANSNISADIPAEEPAN